MECDKPLLQKLSVNATPFETMIFIPRSWILDHNRIRSGCLNAKNHPDFVTMKSVILQTTALAHHNHAAALASLLTWNFQLFPKTQVTN
jgi:hypothetical protein